MPLCMPFGTQTETHAAELVPPGGSVMRSAHFKIRIRSVDPLTFVPQVMTNTASETALDDKDCASKRVAVGRMKQDRALPK